LIKAGHEKARDTKRERESAKGREMAMQGMEIMAET